MMLVYRIHVTLLPQSLANDNTSFLAERGEFLADGGKSYPGAARVAALWVGDNASLDDEDGCYGTAAFDAETLLQLAGQLNTLDEWWYGVHCCPADIRNAKME